MKEFVARGLEKKHSKEIEAWKYMREKKFASELDEEFMDEVERFEEDIKKWKPKELEEFIIEGLDCLK